MDPELVLYVTIVIAVPTVLAGLVLVVFGGRIEAHTRAARRLGNLERTQARRDSAAALRKEAAVRGEGRRPTPLDALRARLDRAKVPLTPARVVVLAAAIAAAVFVGLGLATEAAAGLRAVVAPLVAAGGVHMWLSGRIKKRVGAIEEALPDAVELMVRSLRVGHPFASAIQIVARETEGPLADEMAVVADEMAYGRDVGDALTEMAERVGLQDLRFLAVAVTIQSQSGGNLAEVLDGLAKVVRSRFRLFRRVKAITAEAKFSGFFLSGFPVLAAVGLNVLKPDYFDGVRGSAYFWPAAGVVAVLLVANILVMRRLVDIKV